MTISESDIRAALQGVKHPESDAPLAAMVRQIEVAGERIAVTLLLARARDPFAKSIRREAERAIAERFPKAHISVTLEEPPAKPAGAPTPRALPGVRRIIAISSAKGGVGKSTITANLARALTAAGKKVGILDADIYGPSQPLLFDVADFRPAVDAHEMMTPALSQGVEIMSIGFFIAPEDALVWRGPMATSALRQLMTQTRWGELDFLLIDMPPGTGDVHLTLLQGLRVDGAIVVTTPQQLALADVERGIAMFRAEHFHIDVLGLVENMAWFTPADIPEKRYHLFGRDGGKRLAGQLGVDLLAQIPLTDGPVSLISYRPIVDKLLAKC